LNFDSGVGLQICNSRFGPMRVTNLALSFSVTFERAA
jgi:hypothetical protein